MSIQLSSAEMPNVLNMLVPWKHEGF